MTVSLNNAKQIYCIYFSFCFSLTKKIPGITNQQNTAVSQKTNYQSRKITEAKRAI